ncbi:hypothetical protein BUALT_Bualt13G0109200 [Buddleja alternifolia]|uniref:AAA+ ATPase domain-containing protein n=1 Tax=Buddleja alternifolia TaxID=168488 RepID=A0AAV6WXG4_9LAMI|nr:hypothetical protein BUALT_Bualt13G0109200 [Buddleja alternifolia]
MRTVGRRRGALDPKLRPRIDRAIHIDSVQQMVDHLRSEYPEYLRKSIGPFTKHVKQIFENSMRQRNDATKRRKIGHDGGDVLNNSSGGSSSVVSTSASTSSSSSSSVEDTSTYDLMKLTVRESLLQKAKKKEQGERKAVELEIDNNKKDVKMLNVVDEEGKLGDGLMNKNEISDKKKNGVVMFKDLGGMTGLIEELNMEVIFPLYHPQLPLHLGVKPISGILLHGPPGCGKTKLAHAIANETGLPFYKISATELVSGVSGASEENIRELFSKAYMTAPSIVFIDEIDAIASKRENLQREMERRIVTQLMTCMDESHRLVKPVDENADTESSDCEPGYVLVIGATNRPDTLDPALRRPGRFDREIVIGVPDESARVEILSTLTNKLRVEGAFDLVKIARSTAGFVGADLVELANKAGNLAMKRIIGKRRLSFPNKCQTGPHIIIQFKEDEVMRWGCVQICTKEAAKLVQPSSRREGFSTIPNVKWDDVGGLDRLRQEFDRYVVRRIKFPEYYEALGMDLETGFLLYGPPGCGKTLIAKAVANEAGANFIHIKGPELLNKYVGESELAVRTIFTRARTCAPCLLFFDEVDALTTKRGKEGGWVVERLLNQLLIELDGAEQRRGVYVIGATNRPEVIDSAVLRPGRFGKLLYVPLPSPDERGMILKAIARKKPIDATVDLMAIGKDTACKNFSGADLSALMNEAAMASLEEKLTLSSSSPLTIKVEHFERALVKISPSVSDKQIQYYKLLSENFKAA